MFRPMLLFIALLSMTITANAQKNTLTPELLWKVGRVGLDAVSPDGHWAVYGVQHYKLEDNSSTRVLFLLDLRTGEERAITPADWTAGDAAFHPLGKKIGFLRDGKLYEISLAPKAEPTKVSDEEMNGFKYAPNGMYILFARNVKMDQSPTDKYPDLPLNKARISDGLFYRHWKSWNDYTYSNIFYANYEDGALKGEAVNIMKEAYNAPLAPFGGMEQVNWSPDARFIAYTSRKLKGTAEATSTNSDIFVYEMSSGKTLNFTEDLPGYDIEPNFSPDGKYMSWTSQERPGYEADRTRLMVLDLYTMNRRELTKDWVYECNHPLWSADSKSLYFISAEDFTYQLYQIGVDKSDIRRITTGQHDHNTMLVAGTKLVSSRVSMSDPAEIYLTDPSNGQSKQMTHVTADPWGNIAKGKVERRTVKTLDGKNMNVWVIFPPGFDPKKKYPGLLYCQGGPQSAVSQFFSYRWNFQMMAAHQYIVVAPCRRGMPGSGQEWNDAIIGDYGGKPMDDLLAAMDEVAKEPWMDADRLGCVGASYGGYSVYWLAGHHNKRFKAFISHCGMFNLESFYGTTEEVWFPNNDFQGPYWQTPQPEFYKKFSPHRYVQNWDTPILVVHDELDFRVPLGEGMQAFQAAQLRGIPSRFLYFADEGHWVSKPQNSVLWQREFFEWLDTYLK